MEQIIQQQIANAAANIESQLDDQINAMDSMTSDELKTLRNQRINEMKNEAKKKQEWLNNGHGEYDELSGEKEFFEVSKKSANIIAHFYRDATERCKIVDHHLKILAKKHIEAKFCKVNAENSPFLTQRLRIKVIPTIAIIKDSKTKDYIVGFTDLGNRDDFSTEMMEWRIAQSGAIDYNGDLLTPPDQARKEKNLLRQQKKKIRGRDNDSDDSDIEFSD
ncbi:thioredoxin domain-containing protein 9 [Sitodiplosis mosellana]|uniref:thioredoxin domain-containing protein 9 n=1 Tax=Sitodiplosis mosellana TaxID=263140 RepID=UPI002443A3AA|nr:thioredoxin domain-containing protein 9 [Sitodiplosis mosellana]